MFMNKSPMGGILVHCWMEWTVRSILTKFELNWSLPMVVMRFPVIDPKWHLTSTSNNKDHVLIMTNTRLERIDHGFWKRAKSKQFSNVNTSSNVLVRKIHQRLCTTQLCLHLYICSTWVEFVAAYGTDLCQTISVGLCYWLLSLT